PRGGRPTTWGSLSPNEQRFCRRMQQTGYGAFRNVPVRGGEPQFEPPFVTVTKLRLPRGPAFRPESVSDDFLLKRNVVEFFEYVRSLETGLIETLKIQDGLPVDVEFVEPV